MARVYEALLLSKERAPDQTRKFLDDFDFGGISLDSVDLSSEASIPLSPAFRAPSAGDESDWIPDVIPEIITPPVEPLAGIDAPGIGEFPGAFDIGGGAAVRPAYEVFPVLDPQVDVAVVESLPPPVETLNVTPLPELPPIEEQKLLAPRFRSEFLKLSEIINKTSERSQLKILVVCSVEAHGSADFVTKNLCLALSESAEKRIGLFDLSLPAREARPGDETEQFRIRILKTPIVNLREIVPQGGPISVSRLLSECDVEQMFEMLRGRFDFVVIKTPSVDAGFDVIALAALADGVILTAEKDRSEAVELAKGRLRAGNAKILGAILNWQRDQDSERRVA